MLGLEQFKSQLWTAHGCKLLPSEVDMSIRTVGPTALAALPSFFWCVDQKAMDSLLGSLDKLPYSYFDNAMCVIRNSRRIPLKPTAINLAEEMHLALSSDGLRFFHPVAIAPENCQSSAGLLHNLARLRDSFHFFEPNPTTYRTLTVDVSLYNTLLHWFYGFSGFSNALHQTFIFFGIWHAYMYSHVAIWERFRFDFLGDAFFALFPQGLLCIFFFIYFF